ncbi:MAG: hypothetical protein KME64_42525 [Scytonematopsis contorta HA4267-MV1]|jgi:hypothetical protein|nr:hypothetical protein [Scytonematopsis contorta HA4267-MV1]
MYAVIRGERSRTAVIYLTVNNYYTDSFTCGATNVGSNQKNPSFLKIRDSNLSGAKSSPSTKHRCMDKCVHNLFRIAV